MKEWTTAGGVHVICVITDAVLVPDDMVPFVKGLFPEGRLFELYSDWRLELAASYVFDDEHPGGIRHTHAVNKIVSFKLQEPTHNSLVVPP
jgi:hypothetical protein